MGRFAAVLGAILIAEVIETETELATVTELGINAGPARRALIAGGGLVCAGRARQVR
jgi:hypothetical protein